MGKNYFTPEQVEELRKNKYVKHVSEKAITYTEEFKETFMMEYNLGKLPSQILLEMGLNPKILGRKRLDGIVATIKRQSVSPTGFKDTRADNVNMGRPRTKDLSQEELIERQKQEIEVLKSKVEYLSLLRRAEREADWKAKSKKKKSSK